jgi:hypothetical protein
MGGADLMFVIDTNKERSRSRRPSASTFRSSRSSTPTAIRTASPSRFPGNDDAGRAITLYCDLIARPRSTASTASIAARRGPFIESAAGGEDLSMRRVADDLKKLRELTAE